MDLSSATIDDLRRLKRQLAETERTLYTRQMKLDRDLLLAAKVHNSLLPKPVKHPRISVDIRYLPVEEVGGDYCQVRFADPSTCYITVCDVTGHGIGPALMASRVSSEVRHSILDGCAPRDIVQSLNQFVRAYFEGTELYLTFLATRIDLHCSRITFSGAGHPCPLLIRREGLAVERMISQNSMIGLMDDCLSDEPQQTIDLQPGDRLIYYTDGLTETANENGDYLGTDGLEEIAVDAMSVDLFDAADHILDRVTQRQHGPPTDDKTLIVAEIT